MPSGKHLKMDADEIKEGFLCPMCLKDLRSASILQKHFEESHSDDKDTLRQIRGMFGKAKRKIMDKIDSSDTDGLITGSEDDVPEGLVTRGVDPFLWDHQEFGINCIIFSYLNSKLLIKLHLTLAMVDFRNKHQNCGTAKKTSHTVNLICDSELLGLLLFEISSKINLK